MSTNAYSGLKTEKYDDDDGVVTNVTLFYDIVALIGKFVTLEQQDQLWPEADSVVGRYWTD